MDPFTKEILNNLENKYKKYFQCLNKLEQIESEANDIKFDIQCDLSEIHFIRPEWIEIPCVHECKNSPIGTCYYNTLEDPAMDNCLICHQPHERK